MDGQGQQMQLHLPVQVSMIREADRGNTLVMKADLCSIAPVLARIGR